MSDFEHAFADAGGLRMHYVERGRGPLVILCHGFPESWYSWRHQIPALADAGFRVVAPDQRGYGQTDGPEAIEAYSQPCLVGDVIGLMDALGEERAVLVGHDWGAPVVWNAALLRPDRVRAVVGVSVPHFGVGGGRPTELMKETSRDRFNYVLYFQAVGPPETELEADVATSLRRLFYTLSGDARRNRTLWDTLPRDSVLMDQLHEPPGPMKWISDEELAFFVGEFERRGFRGGLNWYRCLDRSWDQLRSLAGRSVEVPAYFIQGEFDYPGANDATLEHMSRTLPGWRGHARIDGAGHWVQQERPAEFNEALIGFLRSL